MAYEKNTWQTGDVVTATKLNHMENGIKSIFNLSSYEPAFEITFTVDYDGDKYYPNKTYSEIMDIFEEEEFPTSLVCNATIIYPEGNEQMTFRVIYDYEHNEFIFSACGLFLLKCIYYDNINNQLIADFPVLHLN